MTSYYYEYFNKRVEYIIKSWDISTKLGPSLECRMGRGKAPQACLVIASLHISLPKLD